MEDASAVDLDWFWRSWFYTTDYVDIGLKGVKKYHVSNRPSKKATKNIWRPEILPKKILSSYGIPLDEEDNENFDANALIGQTPSETSIPLKEYMMDYMTEEERAQVERTQIFLRGDF